MNNDETYTPCTKCGRPMAYCKGQCCGKTKGCQCKEYCGKVCGAIRPGEPHCPYQAVIPSLTVESVSNLKDLADCFVHVSDINTTFYIDDKHRIMTTWAGPVEYNNYDLDANPLGLRSQFLIDFENSRGAYYNKIGNYEVFNFGNGGDDAPILISLSYADTDAWQFISDGVPISIDQSTVTPDKMINTREVPSAGYQKTGDPSVTYTAEEVFDMLEEGKNVIFSHVPLDWQGTGAIAVGVSAPVVTTNGLKMTARKEFGGLIEHSGVAFVDGFPFGYEMAKITTGGTPEYKFFVQGIDTYSFN